MSKVSDQLIRLQLITAEQGDDEDAIVSAIAQLHQDNETLAQNNATLVNENERFKLEAEASVAAQAESVIQAAIAEGKFSENDKETLNFYRAQLRSAPEQTKKVIAALYPNPVLVKTINVKAGDSHKLTATAQDRTQLVNAQHLAAQEIKRKNQNLSFAEAFNIARRDRPELFPAES